MNAEDLRKLLEKTEDKLSIFASLETLKKYKFNVGELMDLISDFLSDEEKLKLFDYSHFVQFNGFIKSSIIKLVSDENIIIQMLNNDNITKGCTHEEILDIIENTGDRVKQQLLYNQEFIQKQQISDKELRKIFENMVEQSRAEMLNDADFITNKMHLQEYEIVDLIKILPNGKAKNTTIERYQLDQSQTRTILRTLDAEGFKELCKEHKKLLEENEITPYSIVNELDPQAQKEIIENITDLNLSVSEKKEILATLSKEIKQSADTTNLSEEFKAALSMRNEDNATVIIDFERKLEDYRGLDNLMNIESEKLTEEQREQLKKLCEICPNLRISNELAGAKYTSTGREYKEAEEWIDEVIGSLKPEYTNAQKMAVIDNAIGKKISYSPDFDTEVFDKYNCRPLWKIISSGYGVCNGISAIEQYIFSKVGIESEVVSSGQHAFLKVKDIELPLANGEIVKGNTIIDPTWNLGDHRFGARPNSFCISYEQARKNDIDNEGKDHMCHKNDEQLQDANLDLDAESLGQLFASVGLADREGYFPIKDLLEKSKLIDKTYAKQPEQNINKQFELLQQICPEFATCQNESISIIRSVLLSNENMEFNKCAISRVYDRKDQEKRPILFVYIDNDEIGKRFYCASNEKDHFVAMPQEEFVKQYECYENDIKNNHGLRPWETEEQKNTDLSKSNSQPTKEEDTGR